MIFEKCSIFNLLFFFSVYSGGWTNTTNADELELVRGPGFYLKGNFGNPAECSSANTVFVYTSHPQYDQMLSVALSAFMGGKKLMIYAHQCADFGWPGGTHNELTGAMFIKN